MEVAEPWEEVMEIEEPWEEVLLKAMMEVADSWGEVLWELDFLLEFFDSLT